LFKKEIGFAPTLYRNIAWLKKQEQKKQPKNSFRTVLLNHMLLTNRARSKKKFLLQLSRFAS
jgi:hypothetical protein